ncbi:MAG: prealbumin-like fold domain-containing protein [Clostridiales bacterium]|jgi:uncharacterized surface anchored protein|nr:prealbumin-like fold domain-containing protein [Clostridiales bacterium]
MATNKALAVLSLAMLLLAGIPASASAQTADDSELGGQITIIDVDEADNSIRLNGAVVKIVNKVTGDELTDKIEFNGTLVYELELGEYTVVQVSPPEGYELNTRVYDFSLAIPEETNPDTVRIVNSGVTMNNVRIGSAPEPEEEPVATDPPAEQEAPIATDPPRAEATPVPPISKNPETADFSIFYVIAAFLSIAGLTFSAIKMNQAKRRQR